VVRPRSRPNAWSRAAAHGATVVLESDALEEAGADPLALAAREGRAIAHPCDDDLVIAGQSAAGAEMVADAPSLDTLLPPPAAAG